VLTSPNSLTYIYEDWDGYRGSIIKAVPGDRPGAAFDPQLAVDIGQVVLYRGLLEMHPVNVWVYGDVAFCQLLNSDFRRLGICSSNLFLVSTVVMACDVNEHFVSKFATKLRVSCKIRGYSNTFNELFLGKRSRYGRQI